MPSTRGAQVRAHAYGSSMWCLTLTRLTHPRVSSSWQVSSSIPLPASARRLCRCCARSSRPCLTPLGGLSLGSGRAAHALVQVGLASSMHAGGGCLEGSSRRPSRVCGAGWPGGFSRRVSVYGRPAPRSVSTASGSTSSRLSTPHTHTHTYPTGHRVWRSLRLIVSTSYLRCKYFRLRDIFSV